MDTTLQIVTNAAGQHFLMANNVSAESMMLEDTSCSTATLKTFIAARIRNKLTSVLISSDTISTITLDDELVLVYDMLVELADRSQTMAMAKLHADAFTSMAGKL